LENNGLVLLFVYLPLNHKHNPNTIHFGYIGHYTENGIKTQVWCTLIAYLLLQVIQTKMESDKAFSTIAALVRIHLISHLDLKWVVIEGRRAYPKRSKVETKARQFIICLCLNDGEVGF